MDQQSTYTRLSKINMEGVDDISVYDAVHTETGRKVKMVEVDIDVNPHSFTRQQLYFKNSLDLPSDSFITGLECYLETTVDERECGIFVYKYYETTFTNFDFHKGDWDQVKKYLKDFCNALAFLHVEKAMLHGNLKNKNNFVINEGKGYLTGVGGTKLSGFTRGKTQKTKLLLGENRAIGNLIPTDDPTLDLPTDLNLFRIFMGDQRLDLKWKIILQHPCLMDCGDKLVYFLLAHKYLYEFNTITSDERKEVSNWILFYLRKEDLRLKRENIHLEDWKIAVKTPQMQAMLSKGYDTFDSLEFVRFVRDCHAHYSMKDQEMGTYGVGYVHVHKDATSLAKEIDEMYPGFLSILYESLVFNKMYIFEN